MNENEAAFSKKPYEPPQVYRVVITPEELATTGCKSTIIGEDVCNNGSVLVNRQYGS